MFNAPGSINDYKIIISNYAYKTKSVVQGVTDSRRPNRVKPLYRRVTIKVSLGIIVGDMIVCAPELHDAIKLKLNNVDQPSNDGIRKRKYKDFLRLKPYRPDPLPSLFFKPIPYPIESNYQQEGLAHRHSIIGWPIMKMSILFNTSGA